MCGRFSQAYTWEQVHAFSGALEAEPRVGNLRPRYNIAPTTEVHIFVAGRRGRELRIAERRDGNLVEVVIVAPGQRRGANIWKTSSKTPLWNVADILAKGIHGILQSEIARGPLTMSDIVVSAGQVRFGAEWIRLDPATKFKIEGWAGCNAPLLVLLGPLGIISVLVAFAKGPAEGIVTLISVAFGSLAVISQFSSGSASYTVRASAGQREAAILTTEDGNFADSVRAFLEWAKTGLPPGEEYRIHLGSKAITRSAGGRHEAVHVLPRAQPRRP